MNRRIVLMACLGLAAGAIAQQKPVSGKIVLIGGKKSHPPGEHDYPNAIPKIQSFLKGSATFKGVEVTEYPTAWPSDPAALDGASTVVLYFDGVNEDPPPMQNPARIAQLKKAMAAGAGLVCLHQASTVPTGDTTIPFVEFLGAKRNGMFDRTTEGVTLKPATPSHPISRGIIPFTYEDEFYPTLIFNSDAKHIVPILRANLPKEAPKDHVLAWAFERPNGGRAFGFTGLHYIAALDQPQIRKMILNAICWTSRRTVPPGGVVVE